MGLKGTFNLLIFNVILGSFTAFVSIWPITRKPLPVERSVDPGVVVISIWDTFHLLVLKVIWGSFGLLV